MSWSPSLLACMRARPCARVRGRIYSSDYGRRPGTRSPTRRFRRGWRWLGFSEIHGKIDGHVAAMFHDLIDGGRETGDDTEYATPTTS